jgi:NAD(P)H dehydrogenase (quinone)
MSRVLVVYCHPLETSFVAAVRDRVLAGLERAGAEWRLRDLYRERFVPELSAEEHRDHLRPGAHPTLAGHVDDLRWCDALILVYPTWWAGQPAMLKGWFDRVWANGVAWELPEGTDRPLPRLGHIRRIVVVTTHGSSKLVNALEGEGGKRVVTRTLRAMCGWRARSSWLALYSIDTCSEARRVAFLDRVERRIGRITA